MTAERQQGHFVRALGLFDAANIVAGAMIGSGIFIVSQDVAASVGAPGWMLLVWLMTGVMTVMAAVSYGELGAMFPHAGGQYIYLREAFSPLVGFLYGWTLFTVIQTGCIAAIAMGFAKYLGALVPGVSSQTWIVKFGDFNLGQRTIPIGLNTVQLAAILAIALLTANNCINVHAGKWVQNVFTVAKTLALALLIVVGLIFGQSGSAIHQSGFFHAMNSSGAPLGFAGLMIAFFSSMVGPMFASDAWVNVTFVGDEMKNPEKNVGRALMLGTGVVTALYLLANVAYLNLLPFSDIAHAPEQRVAALAIARVTPWGGTAIAIAVVIATLGCVNSMILTAPRVYYAMAQDSLFFRIAGELGVRSGVPQKAVLMQSAWAAALTLSGSYSDLLDYVMFAEILFYAVTVAGILVLRRRAPDVPRPYRALGYPVVPALYIGLALLMCSILLYNKPNYTVPGLCIVGLGIPVYWLWRRASARRSVT